MTLEAFYYFCPAALASLAGLAIVVLAWPKRWLACVFAVLAASAPWLFAYLMDGGHRGMDSWPKAVLAFINLFSMFGCAPMFLCLLLALILSKDPSRRRALIGWAVCGLVAGVLHSVAAWRIAVGLGSC